MSRTGTPLTAATLALIAWGAVVWGALVGCGGATPPATDVISDTDRQRATALRADPVLASTVSPALVHLGRLRSQRVGWDRTEVRGRVWQFFPVVSSAGLQPGLLEVALAKVLVGMRATGWSVYFAQCTPPGVAPTADEPAPAPDDPLWGGPSHQWRWVGYAYRVTQGVSYFALISGHLDPDASGAWIDVVLRAPQEHDQANLFPDQPRPLLAQKSCLDDLRDATKPQQDGIEIRLRDWQPFPSGRHHHDPTLR